MSGIFSKTRQSDLGQAMKNAGLMAATVFALVGCATVTDQQNENLEERESQFERLEQQQEEDYSSRPSVERKEGIFVGSDEIPLVGQDALPDFFSDGVSLYESGIQLRNLGSRLQQVAGVPVRVAPPLEDSGQDRLGTTFALDDDTDFQQTVDIAYEGDLKGLLNEIAGEYGLDWTYTEEGRVVFYDVTTEVFSIAAHFGELTTEGSVGAEGFGGSGSDDEDVQAGTGEQSVEYEAEQNLWEEILNTVGGMTSSKGVVGGNPSAATLVVTDTEESLDRVRNYVSQLDDRLSRQVAVSVNVYSLEVSEGQAAGFDLGAAFESSQIGVAADNVAQLGLRSDTGGGEAVATILDGGWEETRTALRALNEEGSLFLENSASGMTLNNQPLPINEMRQTSYLAEVSTTVDGDGFSETSLEPGIVNTGFSMTVTPNILDNDRVVLTYQLGLSELEELNEISVSDAEGSERIQAPEVSSSSFLQRVAMRPGSTLVVGGFESDRVDDQDRRGLFGFSSATESTRNLRIVTITVNNVSGAN